MKNICTLILFLSFYLLHGTEICNNGIDDDGNGLIDLNDTISCKCTDSVAVVKSIIPNPSFEEFHCCPITLSSMHCAKEWIQPSVGTPDFIHTCGFMSGGVIGGGLLPFPDGNGIAGIIAEPNNKEYVTSCLINKMQKDSQYTIQLNIAANRVYPNIFLSYIEPSLNSEAIDITIFGNSSCSNLTFPGWDCPPAPWYELGKASYLVSSNWSVISISFTPKEDVSAISIGAPCIVPNGFEAPNVSNNWASYFYLDNIILNKTNLFFNIEQVGTHCNNNIILRDLISDGTSYQWYLDGIALVGETDSFLNVSAKGLPTGKYTLTKTKNGFCNSTSIVLSNTKGSKDSIHIIRSICLHDTLVILGKRLHKAGDYRIVIPSAIGCDSIINLTLVVGGLLKTTNIENICQGQSYTINGKTYNTTGTYIDTLKNANGCDSIEVITKLFVRQASYKIVSKELCIGQTFTLSNGKVITTNGNYKDTLWHLSSCDSIIEYQIQFKNAITSSTQNKIICSGQIYILPSGKIIKDNGIHRDTLINASMNGCDSIVIVNLTVTSILQKNNPQTICSGKNYSINGKTYTTSGTYRDTVKNNAGCDSVIITQLNILPILKGYKQDSFCEGGYYTLPSGKPVSTAGTYIDTIKNNNNCDSMITINLTEEKRSKHTYTKTICSNEKYNFFGKLLSIEGVYIHNLISSINGCDSIIELNLIVNPAPSIKAIANPKEVIYQQEVQLDIETISNITNIIWRPASILNDPNISNPIAKINAPTWFVVQVNNNLDCSSYDSVFVTIADVDCLFLPNTFTPNGNDKNDLYRPLGNFFKDIIIFRIYNRWGNLVFETNNPKSGWDGTHKGQLLEPDVFFYYLEGICIDGTKQFIKGDVSLIR